VIEGYGSHVMMANSDVHGVASLGFTRFGSGSNPVLLSGYEARLIAFAEAADRATANLSAEVGTDLETTVIEVFTHQQSRGEQRARAERLEMALRPGRWLRLPEVTPPKGFLEAARTYSIEGGFVDRARFALYRAMASRDLPGVYTRPERYRCCSRF
jgi:hypothetical protein